MSNEARPQKPEKDTREPSSHDLQSELALDLLNLAQDAIIVRDDADRIVFWNAGAEALYGWGRDEVLGRVSHDLLQTRFPNTLAEALELLQRDGRWEGFLRQATRDGREIVTA